MNPEHLHILQHALGLDQYARTGRGPNATRYTGAETYRNNFVTTDNSDDGSACNEMVAGGLMVRRAMNPAVFGEQALFAVTDAGKEYVMTHSPRAPKVSRSAARYARFLELTDVWPDFTFRQFIDWERRQKRGGVAP